MRAPFELTCEHLVDPIGLDEAHPRLSWKSASGSQTAFQIEVSTQKSGEADLWDSGRVASSESHLISYHGKALEPIQRAWWRVRVWDENGAESSWSESTFWEAGLWLAPHWSGAKWIGYPKISLASSKPPAVYLTKLFVLPKRKISRARLFATAKGLYRPHLNGKRIGNSELTPGWTDYHRRIVYDAYDVTSELEPGANVLSFALGDGWYCGHVCWFGRKQYGPFPEVLAKLYVEFEEGEPFRVVSDESWHAFDGPIRSNDLLMGETFDASRSLTGPHRVVSAPVGQVPLVCRRTAPVREVQTILPISVESMGDRKWLVDMGQNMVGRVRLDLDEAEETKVELRHGEILDQKGRLYTKNLRTAKQIDTLNVVGADAPEYLPARAKMAECGNRFTFHGFRYVEVKGLAKPPQLEGVVFSSVSKQTGHFSCGSELVNKVFQNIRWGMLGNYLEVPTDCPQRDERLGWMGDAQIFAPTAAYFYDIASFMTKWLQDVRDAQTEDGAFPNVAPQMIQLGDGAPAWADAGVIVPWTMYRFYGDRRILEQSWDSMVRYVELIERENPDLIWRNRSSHNFGDWLNVDSDTPKEVLATAYFAHSASLVAESARILRKEEEASRLGALVEGIKNAFRKAFVSKDGAIQGETQTSYVLALRFGLLNENKAKKAARRLSDDLQAKGHLTTGFLGVGHLLPVLTMIGRDDLAMMLLLREEYPGWGYSIRQGATTIWERWDGWTEAKGFQDPGMNSFNHYALGSCGEWLFSRLAGIQLDPEVPGFKRFLLDPLFAREIGWVDASYETPYGTIASRWRIEDGKTVWDFEVPPNSSAQVGSSGEFKLFEPGSHRLKFDL